MVFERSEQKIVGPDQAENLNDQSELVYPASATKRLLNFLVDNLVGIVILYEFLNLWISSHHPFGKFFLLFGFFLFLTHRLICESLWQRTLGKLITDTKVVDREGNKPKFFAVFIRSVSRIIPFEPFSFLGNNFPVGWHDIFSKTLVVSAKLSPEQVKKIDLKSIKKKQTLKNKIGGLIKILMITVIVHVVYSMIIIALGQSINAIAEKSSKFVVKASVEALVARGKVYKDSHDSYAGFCKDNIVVDALKAVSRNQVSSDTAYVCVDNDAAWVVSLPLRSGEYEHIGSMGSF